jgi:SAM-dependent methyltransferase
MLYNSSIRLLPRQTLIKTGDVDHADWNYTPILSLIQRLRYRLVLSLMTASRYHRLLEVGYGSGIFLPELSRRSKHLHGIDIHELTREVGDVLAGQKVEAELATSSVTQMPYSDRFFDCVVAVSSLEFVGDLRQACQEVKRVLKPEGEFIVITPGHSAVVDWGLKALTGKSAKQDFGERREQIIPCLEDTFVVDKRITVPWTPARFFSLYSGLRLKLPR